MKGRGLSIVFLVTSVLVCAGFATGWVAAEKRARDARRWTAFVLDSLGTTVRLPPPPEGLPGRDSLYWVWVATAAQIQTRRWEAEVRRAWETRRSLLEPWDLEQLRQAGLSDPATQVRESLRTRVDLVLGEQEPVGAIRMAPPDGIVLLSPRFAFAPYDDGESRGHVFMRFDVRRDSSIAFERLWSDVE